MTASFFPTSCSPSASRYSSPGPSTSPPMPAVQYAGEQCNPYFFNVAWQNDNLHEAIGKHVNDKGFGNVVLVAPNYPAARMRWPDSNATTRARCGRGLHQARPARLCGRTGPDPIAQPDACSSSCRAAWASLRQAVRFCRTVQGHPALRAGFSADEDVIKAVGAPMLGMFNSSQWNHDSTIRRTSASSRISRRTTAGCLPFTLPGLRRGAADRRRGARREGQPRDKAAVRKALERAGFKSVRGTMKFNANHYPVQNYYLRVISRDAQGRIGTRPSVPSSTIMRCLRRQCRMK